MDDIDGKSLMKRKPSGILKSDSIKTRKPSGLSIDVKSSKALDDEVSIIIRNCNDNTR